MHVVGLVLYYPVCRLLPAFVNRGFPTTATYRVADTSRQQNFPLIFLGPADRAIAQSLSVSMFQVSDTDSSIILRIYILDVCTMRNDLLFIDVFILFCPQADVSRTRVGKHR